MPEPECKCGKCRASKQTGQPVCACGKQLEEGFMGILWCPDCGCDWKQPEGTTFESNPEYYMVLTFLSQEESKRILAGLKEEAEDGTPA